MRNYVILYRRGTGKWGRLTPGIHRGLYDKPELHTAIAFLHGNPAAEGVALRLGDESFNVVVTAEPKTENSFTFEKEGQTGC